MIRTNLNSLYINIIIYIIELLEVLLGGVIDGRNVEMKWEILI
jgi:hypothetical protein